MKRILFVSSILIVAQLGFGQVTSTGSTNYIPLFINSNQIGNSELYQLNNKIGIGTLIPYFKFQVTQGVGQNFGVSGIGPNSGVTLQSINDANNGHLPLDITASKISLQGYSGGNVGIGTTNPNTMLHLKKNGGGGPILTFTDDNSDTPTGQIRNFITGVGSERAMSFWTYGSTGNWNERMRIDGNGNVGIGTTSPGTMLSVYNATVNFNGDGKPSTVLNLGAYNNGIGEGPSIDFNLRWNGGYEATSQTTGWLAGRVAGIYDPQVGNGGALAFYTNSGTSAAGGANSAEVSEKLRISPNGNVGIGTTDPKQKLHVFGDIKFGQGQAGNPIPLGVLGNTWTSAENYKFAYIGSTYFNGSNWITNPNAGYGSNYVSEIAADLGGIKFYTQSTTGNTQRTDNTATFNSYQRMVIDMLGNVGIGITNPTQARLVINSGVSNQNAYIDGNRFSLSRTSDAAEIVYLKKTTDLGSSGTANLHGYDGIQFRTSGSETVRMTIAQSGDVKIPSTSKMYFGTTSVVSYTEAFGEGIKFYGNTQGTDNISLTVESRGSVIIGRATPVPTSYYMLNVWGKVRANEVVVNTDGADFVFEEEYALRSIDEVEKFVKENKHLPEIPSAKEMQEKGVGVSELQTKLLQKIEELTLYVIEQNKRIEKLENENSELKSKN